MGVIRPNPTVKTVDGATSVKNVDTIKVTNGDLSVSGRTATIDTSGAVIPDGIVGTIADKQIAFGTPTANRIAGSANFTYTEEGVSTGPSMRLFGQSPNIFLRDDTDATQYETQINQAGGSLFVHTGPVGSLGEFFRLAKTSSAGTGYYNNDKIDLDLNIYGTQDAELMHFDAGANQVWLRSNAYLRINQNLGSTLTTNFQVYSSTSGNGIFYHNTAKCFVINTDGNQSAMQIFSNGTGTTVSPLIDLYSRGAKDSNDKLGGIKWTARPDGGGSEQTEEFARISVILNDNTVSSNDGQMLISVVTNDVDTNYVKMYSNEFQHTTNARMMNGKRMYFNSAAAGDASSIWDDGNYLKIDAQESISLYSNGNLGISQTPGAISLYRPTIAYGDLTVDAAHEFRARAEPILVTADVNLGITVTSLGGQIYVNNSGSVHNLNLPLSAPIGAIFYILSTAGSSGITVNPGLTGNTLNGGTTAVTRATQHTMNACVLTYRSGDGVQHWSLGNNP